MKRKIVRVGASLCILLPKEIIKAMGWDFGQYIDLILSEEDEMIVLRDIKEVSTEKETYLEDFNRFADEYKSVFEELLEQQD